MLEDLKATFKTIETLEKSSTVDFESLKDQVKSDTNQQHYSAVATAKQSLKDLQRLVLFIQESDRKLLSGSSDRALLRRWKAIQPRKHREAPALENTLDEEIQRVICSFDVSSAAVNAALESVSQSQELVVDFQHSTIIPLGEKIEQFLCTVNTHEQTTTEEITTQNQQLDKVRDQIKDNTGEQNAARRKALSEKKDTRRWGVAAGALLLLTPIGPVAALAGGVAAGVAGIVAIGSNELRKDAERLLETLKERKGKMDQKITELKQQVQDLKSVKTDSQQLKRSGKHLESRTQSLSQDARDATLEIQSLKERTSQFAEQFSGLRAKTVDPLLYCQTRRRVLEVLDEAFQDIKALPMAEQMRSITLEVKERVTELHEADTLIAEWEQFEAEKARKEQLKKQETERKRLKKEKLEKERRDEEKPVKKRPGTERPEDTSRLETAKRLTSKIMLRMALLAALIALGWLCATVLFFLWRLLDIFD